MTWTIEVGRNLRSYTIDRHNEQKVARIWGIVRDSEYSSCRLVDADGHEWGTKRPGDVYQGHPPGRPRYLSQCNSCHKEFWTPEANAIWCHGCEVVEGPNCPPPPRGTACISATGYHVFQLFDDGIERCIACCHQKGCGWRPGMLTTCCAIMHGVVQPPTPMNTP
jgi:hypothetical protein